MLKSKVTCWFCNKESQVFLLNKNSWTCESCNQYNGFNKDGDYNKTIPEMQQASNTQQFCSTKKHMSHARNKNNSNEATNLLCAKCNNLQELKLKELNQFDSKNEENFDEEFKIFKSKLDHIYDLCRQCKFKLNQHLQKQDQLIGDLVSKEKQKTSLHQAIKTSKQQTTTPAAKKAYTIAACTSSSNSANTNTSTPIPSSSILKRPKPIEKKYIYEPNEPSSPTSKLIANEYEQKMSKLISTTKLLTKKSTKISCFLIQTVLIDILSFLSIIVIFFSDLVNLINDSGVWSESENNSENDLDDSYLFRSLLRTYKYAQLILAIVILVSTFFAFKRPKVSRFLIIIGFCFNFLIHLNFFQFKLEEKYILEVFMSFFLAAYLTMARVYNVLQLVRYIKSE